MKIAAGARRVRISQRGPFHRLDVDMIKPRPMAMKRALDLAQARRARKLTVEHGAEMIARGEHTDALVAPVLVHKPVEIAA